MRVPPRNVGPAAMDAIIKSPILDLRILATSDLHAHVLAWDYHTDRPNHGVGLARTASLIDQARKCAVNSMLFDNGDFLNGSQLSEHATAAMDQPAAVHPMIAAMNALGYAAANLGNHEFSHGVEWLTHCLEHANFPVLSSNLDLQGVAIPRDLVLMRRFIDRQGAAHSLRIGIIGLLPPQTLQWEAKHLSGRAKVRSIYATAIDRARALRDVGADIVIALCHSGLGSAEDGAHLENQGQRVASIPGIDAVIMGHTHEIYASGHLQGDDDARAPSVMPGSYGSHLGVIDLNLRKSPGGWQVFSSLSETRAVAERDPKTGHLVPKVQDNPAVLSQVIAQHREIIVANEREVAQTAVPLHSFFALVSDTAMGHLLAEAKTQFVRVAVQGTQFEGLPVLAAIASFRSGGRGGPENYTNIPAGPINVRSIADLYTHTNTIVGLCVTGAGLRLWLERSAALYHHITPRQQDAPLIDTRFPSFNYDVIYGISYQIDLKSPAMFDWQGRLANPQGNRIIDLTYKGNAVQPQDKFILVSSNYRVATMANLLGADGGDVVPLPPRAGQDLVANYLGDHVLVSPKRTGFWGFAPMAGTSVVFETSPKGLMYLPQLNDLGLECLDLNPHGFQRFRLHL